MSPEQRKKVAYNARNEAKNQTVAVRRYLTALRERDDANDGATVEDLSTQLEAVRAELNDGRIGVLRELELHQVELDLVASLAHRRRLEERAPVEELEAEFIKCAVAFAQRKGITRQAWTKMGVPAHVLEEAGL